MRHDRAQTITLWNPAILRRSNELNESERPKLNRETSPSYVLRPELYEYQCACGKPEMLLNKIADTRTGHENVSLSVLRSIIFTFLLVVFAYACCVSVCACVLSASLLSLFLLKRIKRMREMQKIITNDDNNNNKRRILWN